VVEEENIKNSDELDVVINEEMEAFIFKNTPYQYPIDTLKYHHSKSSLPLKSVVEYYKRHYVPENMVVSIYSCLSLQTIVSYLKKTDFNTGNRRFSRISSLSLNTGNLRFPRRPSFSLNTGKRILVIKKNTATTYISLGFKTCQYTSEDKYSLELFNIILSHRTFSRKS
jgi:predicted Zn-dependent peptidase